MTIDYSNIQLELLGSLINYPNQIHAVHDVIGARKVFDGKNERVYLAIIEQYESGEKVDVVSVGAKSGVDLIDLMTLGTAFGATSYAKILVDRCIRKELREIGQYATHHADKKDPFVLSEELSDKLFQLESNLIQKSFSSSADATEQAMMSVKYGFQGVTTGYKDLDNLLGGWRNSNLIIIAGRPSDGKTAMGVGSAVRISKDQKLGGGVGIFSLEMANSELMIRILGAEAKIDTFKLSIGRIDEREFRAVEESRKYINSLPLYFDDSSGISALGIKAKARRLVKEKGVRAIFIDYLQLITGDKGGNREQEISSISRTLKATAKELAIPVICLSQLNRLSEGRGDKRPILSDLRESGAIEQDADVVVFVHGKEEKELIVAKHRNGGIGTVPIKFVKQFASFE